MARIRCDIVVAEPITVAALMVWVYRSQKADVMSGRDLAGADGSAAMDAPRRNRSLDGCARLEDFQNLGALIPSTGHQQRPALHADAEAIHDLVVALSQTDWVGATLVHRHGRSGEPPDYCDEIPTPEPVRRMVGKRERIVEDDCLPGHSHLEQSRNVDPRSGAVRESWVEIPHCFCPIRYWPTVACVEAARAEYRLWWRTLATLAARLPRLSRWHIIGLGAEERPWAWDSLDIADFSALGKKVFDAHPET